MAPGALTGLSCDLTKCFNTLPRWPSVRLLEHLGIPKPLCQVFFRSIKRATQTFAIEGACSPLCTATTCFAEGCPWSVLVMSAFCWMMYHLLKPTGVTPACYYDNWGWISSDMTSNRDAMLCLIGSLMLPNCRLTGTNHGDGPLRPSC